MARLPYLDAKDLADEDKAIVKRPINLNRVIAYYNGVVRLLGALEIDVEPQYAPELDAHPLPE